MTKLAIAARWASAVTVTLSFLVGIPMLLLAAPSPLDSDRGVGSIFAAIADDTQVFDEALISVLVGLAWLLWAYLTLAAFAEVVAAVRGGVASIKGLGMGQSLARPVIAALMWSSTATGLAASTLGVGTVALMTAPAAAAQPVAPEPGEVLDQTNNPHGFGEVISGDEIIDLGDQTFLIRGVRARPHVVQSEDTMWDLAERHLGDPFRWREIANLNTDVDDPDLIIAGSLIYMPAEAININLPAPGPTSEPVTEPAPELASVTVDEGDTLWALATDHLEHTGTAAPEVDQVAAVVESVDASELVSGDRNLIFPGEAINLQPAGPPVVVWTPEVDQPAADDIGGGDAEIAAIRASGTAEQDQPSVDVDASAAEAELAAAITEAEAGLDQPASSTSDEPAAPEATLVEDPALSEPAGSEGAPEQDIAGGVGRPPSGQFFGQYPTNAEPPAPPEGAAIDVDAFPPPPAATLQEAEDETDLTNGWDPPTVTIETAAAAESEPVATPSLPIPGGAPVQPEVNSTVNPEDLTEPAGSRTVKSLNWTVLLAALPLLGGGIWAALRRRRRLSASRRPSRYAPTEITDVETDITEALAGSQALERAAKLEALSAQIAQWVPLNAPRLIAITVDDASASVLWDSDLAPDPVGEPAMVVVDGSSWRIEAEDLVTAPNPESMHGLPALVHVGRLLSGRDLFVNLEELGRANLTGEPRAIEQLCGRLAMELALSPLFSLGTLVLIGFGARLAALDNIEHYDSSEDAYRALTPRLEPLARALQTDSALQLRAAGQLDSDISPIVVIDLSDTGPHPELVKAAEASPGGVCLLHSGGSESAWPFTIDFETIRLGGTLNVITASTEPAEETIQQIVAIVAAEIEYEPADTVEGAISDTLMEEDDVDDDVEECHADVVAIDPTENAVPEWLTDPVADDLEPGVGTESGFGEDHVADIDQLVIATWPDPDPLPSTTGVRLRMLGAVTVEGAEFSKRAVRYVELVALMLAKGGKVTLNEISTYMYNGEGNPATIHQLLTRTRKALGDAPDGLPRLTFETPTKQYELHDVSSDYQQIIDVCNQIRGDESLSREEACKLMDSAAQLIKGPPYAAAGETYEWIYTTGGVSQAVIAADSLCRELGEVYLALSNYPRARWSIRQGLKACPACDELYEALIRVIAKDGTRSDLTALWAEIEAAYEAADLDVPHSLATAYGLAVAA